ncbi:histidine kinase [uncultured Aquimarina sp.]|uniref:sensor histidine kinase n=1 Tax=uncultured Aquimarina sp. TaxID=575652 RepID=UPI002608843E|nr:histidine kinase [uncultured Aquimarina sp.]
MNLFKTIRIVGVHLLIWLLNYWFIAIGSDFNWNGFTYTSGSLRYAYAYGLFFNAALFYMQVFWLVPKIYMHNEKVKFYLFSIVVILVISIIETYFDQLLYGFYKIETEDLLGGFITNAIFHIVYSMAGFYFLFKLEHKKSEKIKQQLLEESYKTELKYLKAQLNPHFLFNGINSVYHLIGKNNDLAKDTLLQFSELLRYQLYESGTTILLEKELDYVSQYIKIEETRRGSDIQLEYTIDFENSTRRIAPLLLIPFIENAFKHCSNHNDSVMNTIYIKIIEKGGTLTLHITNSFDNLISEKPIGGIGLNNVKRRMALLYPDKYQLDIRKEKNNFVVDLTIML